MPRFCVKCGYDISTVPGEGRRRQCPECGRVGVGLPPPPGIWWPVRRAAWRAVKWSVLIILVLRTQERFGREAPLAVRLAVLAAGLFVLYGLLATLAAPMECAERWGKWHLPRSGRREHVLAAMAVGVVVNVGILGLAVVVDFWLR